MPLVEVPVQQRCGSASLGLFVCGVWHDAQSGRGDTGETFGQGKVIWYLMLLMLVLHVSLNKRESSELAGLGLDAAGTTTRGTGGGKHRGGRAAQRVRGSTVKFDNRSLGSDRSPLEFQIDCSQTPRKRCR